APKKLAGAFARLSWPAFGVLVVTGGWNVWAVHPATMSTAWQAVLSAKIGIVVLAGVAAYRHGRSPSTTGLAVWGSLAGLASIVALYLGILLAG
ncbi:MAG TPA: hypothetical protein VKG43_13735, partial [Acidimicrobiales bacterium]|nr:hypothetical protein [Acidimicrobiales bacterium]